jgi:hypothetical protein
MVSDTPKPGSLGPRHMRQYLRGRDRAFAELAKLTGFNVLVVEV